MDAVMIVMMDKATHSIIRLLITFKFVTSIALQLQNGMVRLDMGVLVRRLRRYTLMSNPELFTGFCKPMTDEFRTIVRANDRLIHFVKELELHQCLLRDLNQILGFTGQSMVIRDNSPIKHIYDAQQEEKALLTFNPTLFNIRFPQLI